MLQRCGGYSVDVSNPFRAQCFVRQLCLRYSKLRICSRGHHSGGSAVCKVSRILSIRCKHAMIKSARERAEQIWKGADPTLDVRCGSQAASSIAAAAFENSRRLGRGGLEIGGVLLGRHGPGARFVTEWVPITCEHSRGPSFRLSERDEQVLTSTLTAARATGVDVCGFFVSHSRSGLALSDADISLFERFFPDPGQFVLLLKPGLDGTARASVCTRSGSGIAFGPEFVMNSSLDGDARLEKMGRAAPPRDAKPTSNAPPASLSGRASGTPAFIDPPNFLAVRPRSGSLRWVIAAIVTMCLGIAAFVTAGNTRWLEDRDSVALRITEEGQQRRIEWDPRSPLILKAEHATAEINDGHQTRSLLLNAERLHLGRVDIPRESEDVEVVFTVHRANQESVQELARFIGPASAPSSPAPSQEAFRDQFTPEEERIAELQSENEKLKAALMKETARRVQEEQAVRILRQHIRER
jgi:hypothetical protein